MVRSTARRELARFRGEERDTAGDGAAYVTASIPNARAVEICRAGEHLQLGESRREPSSATNRRVSSRSTPLRDPDRDPRAWPGPPQLLHDLRRPGARDPGRLRDPDRAPRAWPGPPHRRPHGRVRAQRQPSRRDRRAHGSADRERRGPGAGFVSSTVKDLIAGAGIEFEDRGEHELKGGGPGASTL
jgi:hypothetical protein